MGGFNNWLSGGGRAGGTGAAVMAPPAITDRSFSATPNPTMFNAPSQGMFGNPSGSSPYTNTMASTDPSMYMSNPYMAGLNQNVYARQANQGYAPAFNQGQFTNAWNSNMQPGSGFNPQAFNSALGINGTGVYGGSTGWSPTNFTMNDVGYAGGGGSPGQQQSTQTQQMFPSPMTQTGTPFQPTPGTSTGPGAGTVFGQPGGGTASRGSSLPSNAIFAAQGWPYNQQGGGSLPLGNPQPGQNINPGTNPSLFTGAGGQQPTPITTSQPSPAGATPDQAMATLPGDLQYLRNTASTGNPVNAMPAWQSMVDAMNRQNQINSANLNEQFNTSGNRFSTAYGTGMSDFWNQTGLNQNALLGQMTMQSSTDAANRMLQAGGQLGGIGANALSQLSSQDYGSQMLQQQQQLQAALAMLQSGGAAANQLAGYSASGTQQLGGQAYGAGSQVYGAESGAASQQAQLSLLMDQLGLSTANQLNTGWNQNLQSGLGIGTNQYQMGQSQINNMYQEFMRTQPQYNPLLQMMYSGATGYPSMMMPGYQPGALGGIMSGLGGLLGGVGSFMHP